MPNNNDDDDAYCRVRYKIHKKRAIARIPLTLGDGLNMSVGVLVCF